MTLPNVLAHRYASPAMAAVWAPERRIVLERRLWITVLAAQRRLGVAVPPGALEAYAAVVERVDLASIEARERRSLHDVKARVEEFNALAGHECIHLGMTSRDLTETVEQMLVAEGLEVARLKAAAALLRIARRAERDARLPLTARTHNVPAQMTTVGRRWAMFGEELLLALERLEALRARLPLRGLLGAVGTRLDQIRLLGSPARARSLDAAVARTLGRARRLVAPGQISPRSLDLEVVQALHQLACGPASFCTTLRLMAGAGLATEGFAEGQTGSSAMPHKTNARSCERVCGLRAILAGHVAMLTEIAGTQWNEGDVVCSVVRRVALPDAFLALDGLFETFLTVLDRMEVYGAVVAAENRRELPFLATTAFLMEAVKRGAGREEAHAALKRQALAAARRRREGAEAGFAEALAQDPVLRLDARAVERVLAAGLDLAGDAPAQAVAFARAARAAARRVKGAGRVQPGPIL